MKKEIVIGCKNGLISWLFVLTLLSCGARKVEKTKEESVSKIESVSEEKKDVVVNTNLKTETKVILNDSTKEIIEETIVEADDKTKPAFFDGKELGNTKTTKRKISRNKAIKSESNTNTSLHEETTDKTHTIAKKSQQNKKNTTIKNTERESLLKWWWISLILLVLFGGYKTYRKFTM